MRNPLLLLLLPALFPFTFAAEVPEELPPMLVTATLMDTPAAEIPNRVVTLDSGDLRLEHFPRTTPEALRELPSVLLQKTSHGQGSPYLRGWTGFRTLLLIDGVRLNNSVFRDGPNQYWNTVDPFSLERIEVVYGPSSVLYGSDAIGGTVQAFRVNPLERAKTGENGRAYLRWSSAEDSWTGRLEGNARVGDATAARAGYTQKSFGNLRAGSGTLPKTAYDEWSADAAVSGLVQDGARWTLSLQTLQMDDAWRTHRTPFAVPFRGTSSGTDQVLTLDQERSLATASWEQALTDGAWRDVHAVLSWQRQSEEQFRQRSDGRRDIQAFDVDSYALHARGSLGEDTSLWTFGTELGYDDVASSTTKAAAGSDLFKPAIQGPVGDDASYTRAALFAQNRYRFAAGTEIIAGLRGEHLAADVDRYEDPRTAKAAALEDEWQALVGSLRVRQPLSDIWQLYGGVSQGFRAPNLSDLTRLDTARSGEREIPSPDLDPERFLQYELGLRCETGDLDFDLSLYRTEAQDLIVRTPTGAVGEDGIDVRKTNASDAWVHGLELTLAWTPDPAWRLWGVASYMDGEADGYPSSEPEVVREPLSRLMPLTFHAGLRHTLGTHGWIEAVVSHAETADKLSSGDQRDTQRIPVGGTPAYTVCHLRSGWYLTEDATLGVALENLTDRDYRVHGSGLNEAGRNLIVSLEVRF